MQLFYTPDISGEFYTLSAEESKHAVQVLRVRSGEVIHLIDGRGGLYKAEITEPSPKGCVVRVVEQMVDLQKRSYKLHMAVAPTKNIDRFEWFLEKATEIGVDRITPLLCQRSERKIVKKDRSEKVVVSAVKQSLKASLPVVDELTRFEDFLKCDYDGFEKYIAHCDLGFETKSFAGTIKAGGRYVVLIGPEGDFSPQEIELAYKAGFTGVSLGNSRLRTETAAVMTVSAANIINQ